MPPCAPRQTPKHMSKAVSCAPTDLPLQLRLCKPACAGGQWQGRFPQQPLCCTSPEHLPYRSTFAACQVAIITSAYERLQIPGAHFTNYTEHGANCTWSGPTYQSFQSLGVWGWMEKRWLSGALKALRQATAEDALAHSASWEPNNSQNTKNVQEEISPHILQLNIP